MKFSTTSKSPADIRCDVLAVVTASGLRELDAQLPPTTVKQVRQQARREGFKGEPGRQLSVHAPEGIAAGQLLVTGSGKADRSDPQAWSRTMTAIASSLSSGATRSAALVMPPGDNGTRLAQLELATRLVLEKLYRFDSYRSKPQPGSKLASLTFAGGNSAAWKKAVARGEAIAAGVNMARDLGNQPPNVCHPDYLVSEARKLATRYDKLKVSVLSEKQAEKLGMGAFCAVARGSERDGKLITFEYQGAKGKPVALVGKGITFDTGGISLKPGAAMDEMKYDMCGAASVFGTVKAICEMDLPIHLVAVVAAAENMPDGRASRPGDIVRTLSGQTVEILNTDAEGRLVLCDALTWVQQKYQPHTVVDIATLTGACVVALGAHAQAVYANNDKLADALLEAGKASADRGWQMPLWDDYQQQLDSPFADMANIGGPKAGSITAACFLSRFANDVKWAHLDIAGTAWISGGKTKGATGRPVPMLTRFLQDL